MASVTSVRLTDCRRQKLRQLANALGISPNAVVNQLVDNAQIAVVNRSEAVAALPGMNNRHDAQVSQGLSVTAVSA
jgi:hypothetical protein